MPSLCPDLLNRAIYIPSILPAVASRHTLFISSAARDFFLQRKTQNSQYIKAIQVRSYFIMASERLTAPLVITAAAIWPPVCATIVALRFYTRKKQAAELGPDDWLTVPALVWHRASKGKETLELIVCVLQILLIGMCASALRGISSKCSNLLVSVLIGVAQASLFIQSGIQFPKQQALTLSRTTHPISSRRLERYEWPMLTGKSPTADRLLGLVVNRADANPVSGPDQTQLPTLLQTHFRQGQRQSLQRHHKRNGQPRYCVGGRILL